MKEKTLAVLCHLGGFFGGWLLPIIGGVVAPLIIWGIGKTPERQLLNNHGKESINFQISLVIYVFVIFGAILLGGISFGLMPLMAEDPTAGFIGTGSVILAGIAILGVIGVFEIICVIVAIIKATNGQDCHYPLTIRFVK